MGQVILGRVISGTGTSGMTALVSVLITGKWIKAISALNPDRQTDTRITLADLLPLREVAQWRAYVNVVATSGRSIGGPLGGCLADVVGWRW